MKFPLVLRKTFDQEVEDADAAEAFYAEARLLLERELAACRQSVSDNRDAYEQELMKVVKPLVQEHMVARVEHRQMDGRYSVMLQVSENELKFFQRAPEGAVEAISRHLTYQIVRKIQQHAQGVRRG